MSQLLTALADGRENSSMCWISSGYTLEGVRVLLPQLDYILYLLLLYTSNRIQKGNISKNIPALIGIEASVLE